MVLVVLVLDVFCGHCNHGGLNVQINHCNSPQRCRWSVEQVRVLIWSSCEQWMRFYVFGMCSIDYRCPRTVVCFAGNESLETVLDGELTWFLNSFEAGTIFIWQVISKIRNVLHAAYCWKANEMEFTWQGRGCCCTYGVIKFGLLYQAVTVDVKAYTDAFILLFLLLEGVQWVGRSTKTTLPTWNGKAEKVDQWSLGIYEGIAVGIEWYLHILSGGCCILHIF